VNVSPAVLNRGYLWKVLALLIACQMIAYIDRVNLSVAAPVLIRAHGYTAQTLGILFSTFNWVFTVAILFAGPFVDRVRARIAYGTGASLWSLGTLLTGVTTAFVPLMLFRALVGIGEGPMIPAGQRVIRESFPAAERTSAVGAFFAGNKVGLALGIPFAAVILHGLGLPWVFYLTGLLGIIWVALFLSVYRNVEGAAAQAHEPIVWWPLLRYRTTWGMMLGNAGYLYIYYVFATWLPGYLVLDRHMSVLNSGFVGSLPFIVGVIVTVFGGWVCDRLVERGIRITLVRKSVIVAGLVFATIFTLCAAFAVGDVLAVACLTLAVAGFSFSTAALQAIPVDIAPPKLVGSLAALHNFGGNVGGSFAPIVTGVLVTMSGSFVLPLVVTAGVALVLGCVPIIFLIGNIDHELGAV
jgi:ACS family D-galactonate transporter-like MFS transporter